MLELSDVDFRITSIMVFNNRKENMTIRNYK